MRWVVALVLLAWCGGGCIRIPGDDTPKEGQAEALRIVWNDIYGRSDAPPRVYWMQGADLDCDSPTLAGARGFTVPFEGCVDGIMLTGGIVAAAWNWNDRFWTTSVDHELAHALQSRRGYWDPIHAVSSVWGAGGLRERAETALRDAGF